MLVSGIDLSAHEAVSDAAADTQCTYRHRSVGDAETHEHCLMDSFIHILYIVHISWPQMVYVFLCYSSSTWTVSVQF